MFETDPENSISTSSNPYRAPASGDREDVGVVLAPTESFRVVEKKLYCRRTEADFSGICWLTGSTEQLIGVHEHKGHCLTRNAGLWVSLLPITAYIVMDVGGIIPKYLVFSGVMVAVMLMHFGTRVFGTQYRLIVGESAVTRKKRKRYPLMIGMLIAVIVICLGAVLFLASGTIGLGLAATLMMVCLVVAAVFRFRLSPRRFSPGVMLMGDDVIVISGLTPEFLQTLQS